MLKYLRLPKSSFIKDVFLLARGVFVAQLMLLAAYPVLTRIYSPEAFGQFGVIFSSAIILALFATLKVEMIIPIVSKIKDSMSLLSFLVGNAVVFSVFVQVIIYFNSAKIGTWLDLSPTIRPYLHLLPTMIFVTSVYLGIRSWLVRMKRFSVIGTGQIVRAPANIAVAVGAPSVVKGMADGAGLVVGQLVSDVVMAMWMGVRVRRREWRMIVGTSLSRMKAAISEQSSLLLALFTSQAIATLHGRLPLFVIAFAYGATEAGFYVFAERIIAAPFALIAVPISDVYRQRAARRYDEVGRFDDAYRQTLKLTLSLLTIPIIVVAIVLPYVVGPVFGTEWEGAVPTLLLLLLGAYFSFNHTAVAYGSTIVGAKRFIVLWHVARLVGELIAAGFAVSGMISYFTYLLIAVSFRVLAYTAGLYLDYRFACGEGMNENKYA